MHGSGVVSETQNKREVTIRQAHGQCECTGECGHNHQWQEGQPPKRCRAPFGFNIRRKKDHKSFWVLAPSFSGPIAHPEHFGTDDILVKVTIVSKDDPEKKSKRITLAFCERCGKLAGDLNAVRIV